MNLAIVIISLITVSLNLWLMRRLMQRMNQINQMLDPDADFHQAMKRMKSAKTRPEKLEELGVAWEQAITDGGKGLSGQAVDVYKELERLYNSYESPLDPELEAKFVALNRRIMREGFGIDNPELLEPNKKQARLADPEWD